MAFKRYIYKHGKKLGPYYYENVRSPDGKVKSIYLGTNPNNNPRHVIKRPLFLLIVVLSLILIFGSFLFFMQNGSYLAKTSASQEPDFDVDQILFKVLVKSGEFAEQQLRVMNTADNSIAVNIAPIGLYDILSIDSSSFIIRPGQTKVVALNFSSYSKDKGVEQQPGVYVGKLVVKSEKTAKEIPIVIEVQTKNLLFGLNLNPVAIDRKISQGSDATIEVRLFNLQSIDSTNVDVEYFVKDTEGNTISTESQTVVVKSQASFFKTISIPKKLKPGLYIFAATAKFGDSVGTASYLFEVVGPENGIGFVQFCKNSVLCLGLSFTTILLLFAVTAYFYFFVGAYLYKKAANFINIKKEKEKEEEETAEEETEKENGFFSRIKDKISEWKQGKEGTIEEDVEVEEPQNNTAKETKDEKPEPENKLEKFFRALNESKKALNSNDIQKAKELYAEAKGLYADLEREEKKVVYGELMELYKHGNELVNQRGYEEESNEESAGAQNSEDDAQVEKAAEQELKELETEQKIIDKRKKLGEFYESLNLAKEYFKNNDVYRAKHAYIEARRLYTHLDKEERKMVYDDLKEIYHKLQR